MSEDKAFAAWLRRQLDRREWNGAELARRTEVSPTSVSRWLNAREIPSPDNAMRIADAFHMDPDDVLALAGHRIPDRPLPPDDPITEINWMLRGIRLTEDRVAMIKAILTTYRETDRESQDSRVLQVA